MYYVVLKLSIYDLIVCQKGSNGDGVASIGHSHAFYVVFVPLEDVTNISLGKDCHFLKLQMKEENRGL